MNLIIDGIIEKLQNNGGITTYFQQLIGNYISTHEHSLNFISYTNKNKILDAFHDEQNAIILHEEYRIGERYRKCCIPSNTGHSNIFHSTYYRLPSIPMPVVTTVHDFTYELYVNGPKKWVHSWQKQKAILNSNKIICVSNNTALDLMRYCRVNENNVTVIYNGVSESYKRLSSLIQPSNNVIFVGSRASYKNFTLAVKSISEIPNLTLSIIGGGRITSDEQTLLDTNLPNRYKALGYVTEEELNILYNNAFCLLYPSSYEGFGIPVIEAMKSGCPVIAVNASSIPEVAGDAAILVDQPLISEFVAALKTISNQNERIKYIDRGLVQAKKFSWSKCYNETMKIYNET